MERTPFGSEDMQAQAVKTVFNGIANEVGTHTVQLWLVIENDADKAKPFGSAILLEANGSHYLLTAAHVLDDIDVSNLAFWDDQDLVQVSGKCVYLSTKAEINKKADVAIWQLSDDATSALLKHYTFLPFDRVSQDHQIVEQERYLLLGYPVSKTKKIYKTMTIPIKSLPLFTRGVINQRKLERNELDGDVNLMVEYHRRKAQSFGAKKGQIEHLPDPHGMSGCGLWYIDADKTLKLVGVMTGYNHTDSVMIASRIDLVTEVIRLSFDSTLPPSNTIKVHWINQPTVIKQEMTDNKAIPSTDVAADGEYKKINE